MVGQDLKPDLPQSSMIPFPYIDNLFFGIPNGHILPSSKVFHLMHTDMDLQKTDTPFLFMGPSLLIFSIIKSASEVKEAEVQSLSFQPFLKPTSNSENYPSAVIQTILTQSKHLGNLICLNIYIPPNRFKTVGSANTF